MTATARENSETQWTSVQAYSIAAICLCVGIFGGWLIRGSQKPAVSEPGPQAITGMNAAQQGPTPEQVKQIADTQASPLLAQLKSEPNNADLLASIGNIYYDAQQFPAAIEYYKKSLQIQPNKAAVRTDLATAYWYTGNADGAITEFNRALQDEPTNPNTLFNLGIVKLHGKQDVDGAVAAWQKLLDSNPNYENKEKVQDMIRQAKKH